MRIKAGRRFLGVVAAGLLAGLPFTEAVATEQCIAISNLPNSEQTYRWLPDTTLTDLAGHIAKRRQWQKPQSLGAPAAAEWPYGLSVDRGEGDVLWFSSRFKGWKPLSDTAVAEDLLIVLPHHLSGEGTLQLTPESDVLAYIVTGSPAFRKGKRGYAVHGTLRYITAGSEGDPLMLKMFKPIVDTIGSNAVFVQLTLEAEMVGPEAGEPTTRCVMEASLVYKKDR